MKIYFKKNMPLDSPEYSLSLRGQYLDGTLCPTLFKDTYRLSMPPPATLTPEAVEEAVRFAAVKLVATDGIATPATIETVLVEPYEEFPGFIEVGEVV